jgi:hypothetical protein
MIEYWTALAIGLMMIISPWVLGFSDISLAKWCNILFGLVLVVVNARKICRTVPSDVLSVPEDPQKRKRKIKNNVE